MAQLAVAPQTVVARARAATRALCQDRRWQSGGATVLGDGSFADVCFIDEQPAVGLRHGAIRSTRSA